MKKLFGLFFSVIMVIALAFGLTACSDGYASPDPEAYSFITVDINPSVEIIALGGDVVDVKAANYDASVLLEGEDFSSMTVEQAAAKIVSLSEEMGYLTDSNNQVKISVISDDAQTVEILKAAAKSGAQKGSKKAVVTSETRLQDELTVNKLKEEKPDKFADLTEEKVRLIESVMEHDSSMTYEAGAEMSVKELSTALKSAIDENRDIFTAELRSEYSTRYSAKKQEIEREIAAVYGGEYTDLWEKYTALENQYNSIVTALDKAGLTEEDVIAVTDLLGISDASLIEKGGIVKPEYVLNYIDKHIGKKAPQEGRDAVNAVTEILDKYDVNSYTLSEEEIAGMSEAVGESVDFTVLSDVESNLKERKAALDAVKASISLTDEQIEQIRNLEARFSSVREAVLEDMQDLIAATRAEIAAEKEERAAH